MTASAGRPRQRPARGYVHDRGRQLSPSLRQAGPAGVHLRRPRRGRPALDGRRRRVDRRHGEPVVLQRRPRPSRHRRRRRRADPHARGVLVLRAVHQPAGRRARRPPRRELSPIPSSRVFLCGSGSEAVDTAIKLARLAHSLAGEPQRTLIISRQRGYHGTNLGGTSAQGIEPNRAGLGTARPRRRPGAGRRHRGAVGADGRARRRGRRGADRADPGRRRRVPATPGYLAEARALCDRHGALLVFDEVITGFGRLGTWFAAEAFDVVPDMITFAKAVTSGYQQVGGVIVGATGSPAAGVRRQLHPAPRLHVLRPRHGVRRGAAQPRRARRRGVARTCRADRQAPRRRPRVARRRRCDRPRARHGGGVGGWVCAPIRTPWPSATRCSPPASSPGRSAPTRARSARRS